MRGVRPCFASSSVKIFRIAAEPAADPGFGHALCVSNGYALVLEGEITRRGGAAVEMLMKPHVRGNDQRADLPIIAARLIAFRPHRRIAPARENDDVGTRAVRVPLLVGADRKLRDVAVHGAFGHVEPGMSAAGGRL